MVEERIRNIFEEYLDAHGYQLLPENIQELIDIYMDCQDWDVEEMLTGISGAEMYDWIKHTKEVGRIVAEANEAEKMKEAVEIVFGFMKNYRRLLQRRMYELNIAGL